MAKIQQKSEIITAFGGIFFVLDKFDSILSSVIDSHLGLRSKLIGYQYSEIIRAVFSVFCCGGDCMEDLNLYLKDVLTDFREDILKLPNIFIEKCFYSLFPKNEMRFRGSMFFDNYLFPLERLWVLQSI
jgi:hypothetical protein